jgi:multicomponent Na+:H+ antiporter subunit E
MTNLLMLPLRAIVFALWFAGQVVHSSWIVLSDIVTPGLHNTPCVVRMPLASHSDFHVAVVGFLITLTPRTLVLGVVEHDGAATRALRGHCMYYAAAESALGALWDMERRMLNAFKIGGTS